MTGDWRRYPLSSRLLVEAGGSRSARHVRALAGASDWRRELLDRVGAALLTVAGSRPWPRGGWAWPALTPHEMEQSLAGLVDGVRLTGVAMPRQADRQRLSLLGSRHGTDVVIKLGARDDGLETEATALELLAAHPLPGILTPSVLAAGTIADGTIAVLATDALGLIRQRPAIDVELSSFENDLAVRLASLPRPAGTAGDAVPVHGDLAPWNLRHTDRGLALFDWEAAGWGRPGSDLEHYRAACATLSR